jgi:cytochrome c oxidase subunit 2
VNAPAARVYFDVGKVALPKNIDTLLQPLVDYALAHPQARISIEGFHDRSGSFAKNAELAKNRALAVSKRLKGLGISGSQIDLHKPAVTAGSGNRAEARRVEVNVQ